MKLELKCDVARQGTDTGPTHQAPGSNQNKW